MTQRKQKSQKKGDVHEKENKDSGKEWVKNLGLMNEWEGEPDIYINCVMSGHWKNGIAKEHRNSPESIYLGHCSCPVCRYSFSVDAS